MCKYYAFIALKILIFGIVPGYGVIALGVLINARKPINENSDLNIIFVTVYVRLQFY